MASKNLGHSTPVLLLQRKKGRDLVLTLNFRSVLGEILTKPIGAVDSKSVFPGFDDNTRKFLGLIKT